MQNVLVTTGLRYVCFYRLFSCLWQYWIYFPPLEKATKNREKRAFVWVVILSPGYYALLERLSILSPIRLPSRNSNYKSNLVPLTCWKKWYNCQCSNCFTLQASSLGFLSYILRHFKLSTSACALQIGACRTKHSVMYCLRTSIRRVSSIQEHSLSVTSFVLAGKL